jgi:hypothetical protein
MEDIAMQDENADLFTDKLTNLVCVASISALGGVAIAAILIFTALAFVKLPPVAALCGGGGLAMALHPLWFETGKIAGLIGLIYIGFGGHINLPLVF